MRIRFLVEYDGTCFSGWQRQPGKRTVQGEMESMLEHMCGRNVSVTGSGRTDAGVHAAGQVAHADILPHEFERISRGFDSALPDDIAVLSVVEVLHGFHARYDAVSRLYRYRIAKSHHPLICRYSHVTSAPLDTALMREAAGLSLGKADWKAMAKEGSGNADWIVDVIEAGVSEDRLGWTLLIHANRFLRGLVRIWAGTLLRIGSGAESPGLITKLLESGERNRAGASLPAKGLTLLKVNYPKARFR